MDIRKSSCLQPRKLSVLVMVLGCMMVIVSFFLPRPVIMDGEDSAIGVWTHLMDVGNGLFFLAFSLYLFMLIAKVQHWSDFLSVKALSKGWQLVIAAIASVCLIPAGVWYYYMRSLRGDYPPNHDSIMIPILNSSVFCILAFVLVMALVLLSSFARCTLPTTLGARYVEKTFRRKYNQFVLWFLIVLALLCLLLCVADGDQLTIPIIVAYLYVLFSLRAGKANYTW